jgi:hypothetical protein
MKVYIRVDVAQRSQEIPKYQLHPIVSSPSSLYVVSMADQHRNININTCEPYTMNCSPVAVGSIIMFSTFDNQGNQTNMVDKH